MFQWRVTVLEAALSISSELDGMMQMHCVALDNGIVELCQVLAQISLVLRRPFFGAS